ncbi:prepilin-type N-terminal cleavage/methylation domain-containing protein [bacterium]|nr:prepilin-type N-terminal cleavage/methylation domain-containing protein [bacterium]
MLNIKQKIKRGFTLLELLVVMTIIGILMATSFTSFVGVGRSNRFEGAARALKNKILLTRTTAITKSRKFAIRITLTKHKKWKLVIIDSVDNILDNDDDRIADKPYFFKKISLDEEQEIEFTPEGGISYSTSNPIVLTDSTNKREVWKIPIILYKAAGMAKIGDLEKIDMTKKDEGEEGDNADSEDSSLEDQLGLGE